MMLFPFVRAYGGIDVLTTMNSLEDESGHPLPLHLEPLPLPRDVLCSFPCLGTVLRVIFDRGIEKWCLHSLHAGKWVKFVNLTIEVDRGLWHGVLTPFTKLRYTPDDDDLVLERQRLLILSDDISLLRGILTCPALAKSLVQCFSSQVI